MTIIEKAIHIIDYENSQVYLRQIPETFEAYVADLISHIGSNDSVREYKTRSNATEVIGSILALYTNLESAELVSAKMDGIARRLLLKEVEAQEKIARTSTNVQKGSLIQALLLNDTEERYIYLLAKVEHTEWVDDSDLSFKTGFSKDKKTLWKSCLIDLPDMTATEFHAKIYSNTVAKYWSEGFLEFIEVSSDESNTRNAFKAIEATLNQNFRSGASPDHTIIRNHFIGYLKNNEHIDFEIMVNSILEHYQPVDDDLKPEKVQDIRIKLLEQPQKRKFDNQFNAFGSAINARIRKVYTINDGIELKVTRGIEDLPGTIQSIEENGVRYIRVRTNNETTYKKFQTGSETNNS